MKRSNPASRSTQREKKRPRTASPRQQSPTIVIEESSDENGEGLHFLSAVLGDESDPVEINVEEEAIEVGSTDLEPVAFEDIGGDPIVDGRAIISTKKSKRVPGRKSGACEGKDARKQSQMPKKVVPEKEPETGSMKQLTRMIEALHKSALDMVFDEEMRPVYNVLCSPKKGKNGNAKKDILYRAEVRMQTLVATSVASLMKIPKEIVLVGSSSTSNGDAKQDAAKKAIRHLEDLRDEIQLRAQLRIEASLQSKLKEWNSWILTKRRKLAFQTAKKAVLEILYGATVVLFGSAAFHLALPNSDIDVSVTLPSPYGLVAGFNDQYFRSANILKYLAIYLEGLGMKNTQVVDSARVPVLKYFDPECDIKVDIVVQPTAAREDEGILRSRFLRAFVLSDPRVWEVAMVVKYWASCRKISAVFDGYINSMTWVLMVFWFLQTRSPPVAPRFVIENRKAYNQERDAVVKLKRRYLSSESWPNDETTLELIIGFFEFYASKFDSRSSAVCVRTGRPFSREKLKKPDQDAPLFVEDPLNTAVNLATKLRGCTYETFRDELHRALRYFRDIGDFDRLCTIRKEKTVRNNSVRTPIGRNPTRSFRRGYGRGGFRGHRANEPILTEQTVAETTRN